MKRIFMLFLLTMNMLLANKTLVHASSKEEVEKNLICNVGFSQGDMLQYEGYTIESSNVNFNKCGTYQIVYKENRTNEEVVKHVTVKTNDQLVNGVNFEVTRTLYFEGKENIYFHKILRSSDGGYFVSYNERIIDGQEETYHIKLMKIKDQEIVWDVTLFSNAKGKIADFMIDGDKLILFVEKENAMSKLDVYVYIYRTDGTLLTSRQYKGSDIDHAIKVTSDDLYYYLVGETTSDDDDYRFQHTKKAGFVFCIDKTTLEDVELYDATASYDLTIIDAVTSNGYLYVMGRYYNSNEAAKRTVLYIYRTSQRRLANLVRLTIPQQETVLKLVKNENDEMYIATNGYDYDRNIYVDSIYSMGKTGATQFLFDITYEKAATSNLMSLVVTPTNQIIVLYSLFDASEENPYGYLYRVYQENEVLFEVESFSSHEQVNGLLENESLEIYKSSHSTLSCDDISYAHLTYDFHQNIESPSENMMHPSLFIDGVEATLDLEQSVLPKNPSIYGSYPVKYVFHSSTTDVIFQDDVYYMPYTSLKNNETYDVNTMLFFNGKATLNQYQIENGYLLVTPGDYTLEVIGKNDEIYTVCFTIEQISKSEEKNLPSTPHILPIDSEIPLPMKQVGLTSFINEETIVPKKKNNLWYLLIPVTLFVGLGIVIRKRR